MDYFMLCSKKEKGCPTAENAILYDKFYTPKEAEKVDIGNYPWYKNVNTEDVHFPDGLFFDCPGQIVGF